MLTRREKNAVRVMRVGLGVGAGLLLSGFVAVVSGWQTVKTAMTIVPVSVVVCVIFFLAWGHRRDQRDEAASLSE